MIWLRRNVFEILDVLKFVGILLLVLMFIHFNTAVATQAQETKDIAASTNNVVKSQGDILKAIKQVTIDTQLTAQQQTAIIICMLQVPIEQRTTDLQAQCRSQATPASTASPPKAVQAPAPTPQSPSSSASSPSSSSPSLPASSPSPASTPKSPGLLKQIIDFLGV